LQTDSRERRLKSLENQISRLRKKVTVLESMSNSYSWARLIVFAVGFSLTVIAFPTLGKTGGLVILLLSLAAFFTVVYFHFQLDKKVKRNRVWLGIKSRNRARMNLDWENIPDLEMNLLIENHPFATDLDITGKKSLFRLMDISISEDGSRVLLEWLTETEPDFHKVIEKQAIVKELKRLPIFRDKLLLETYILSHNPFEKWNAKRLLGWISYDNSTTEIKKVLNIATALLVTSYLLLILGLFLIDPLYWKIVFIIYAIHFFSNNNHTKQFFRDAISIDLELRKINTVLQKLEKFNFGRNLNLAKFCEPFRQEGLKPSYYLQRMKNLVASAMLQSNPAVWILSNAIFPWDFFHGYRLKKYKGQIAEILPVWLEKLYDLEAMISLANFAYINPDYVFPELSPRPPEEHAPKSPLLTHPPAPSLEGEEEGTPSSHPNPLSGREGMVIGGLEEGVSNTPLQESLSSPSTFTLAHTNNISLGMPATAHPSPGLLNVVQIGHPLLPTGQKVCNNFRMDTTGNLIIITGSNMAGKSTFLRTLGINFSMAFAGGAVNAESFQTVLFRIFTCIKVSDSVTDGLSYFYAEVKRLKALLNELERPHEIPLFFLVDEIFRGTNNRERLIGSRSYIHALAGRNGTGIISTHDLELIKLADTIPEISNYHFRDEISEGRMTFDYRLHKGPCPTTNALKIMKMEGLPVEEA
jgi:hypothetical protein